MCECFKAFLKLACVDFEKEETTSMHAKLKEKIPPNNKCSFKKGDYPGLDVASKRV
jgi:hypothetical protein